LTDAANFLKNGELVAFPTDTFFALGADATNADAVKNVFVAKERFPDNPVPVLIDSIQMVDLVADEFPHILRELAESFWPGALTIVLPATSNLPGIVTGGTGTVGVRVPDHPLARDLINLTGVPLTGTSCNISGDPPTQKSDVVKQQLGSRIAMCVDAACGGNTEPSTVVTLTEASKDRVSVIRSGAISSGLMRKVIGDLLVT
jgi:L-threonylcarbamoyladenylate synthase